MNRRGFLQSIIAAGAAPAIVRADSLMRIVQKGTSVIVPVGTYGRAYWDPENYPHETIAGIDTESGAIFTEIEITRIDDYKRVFKYIER